jgi:hypothetical protein
VGSSAEKTQSLVQVIFVSTALVLSGKVNGSFQEVTNHPRRGCDTPILRSNVGFESSPFVDGELNPLVNRATQAGVVSASIFVIGVI